MSKLKTATYFGIGAAALLLLPSKSPAQEKANPFHNRPNGSDQNQVWQQGDDSKTMVSNARKLLKLGSPDEAIKLLDAAIARDSSCAEAYHLLGKVKASKGDLLGAIMDIGKAVQLDQNNAEAFGDLGTVLFNKGAVSKALMCFGVAIGIDSSAANYSKRASAYFQLGIYEAAEQDYDKAAKLAPNDAKVHTDLGDTKQMLGKDDEAMEHYNKAIELDSTWSYSYSGKGVIELSRDRYDEAIKDFKKALELDPGNEGAAEGLQAAQELRDRLQKGMKRT